MHRLRLLAALAILAAPLAAPLSLFVPRGLAAQAGRSAYDEGMRLMRAGDGRGAERQFERAIAREKGVGLYHQALGQAIGMQAATASVVRQPFMARRIKGEFEEAIKLDPALLDARDGLIQFHLLAPGFMGGDPAKARAQQAEIAKRDAGRGHLAAATIAWHARDTVATERAMRAAIAAVPDSAAPALQLGARLASWGRATDALVVLESFLARQPAHVGARYQYGRLSVVHGGDLPRAERYFRALASDTSWAPGNWAPSRAAVHARLGDALRLQGKRDTARAQYEMALALDRQLQLAKDGLKALEP
jgi:tetratricopeptide (TPR) repeat protein